MAFTLTDLAGCARAANWLWENGFQKVNSAELQYHEFGQQVKLLSENLEMLVQCATSIERDVATAPPKMLSQGSRSTMPILNVAILLEVCDDFRKTIKESKVLLKHHVSYGREKGFFSGPITSILWNANIKSEVTRFKDAIANHNRKIVFVLEPFKLKLQHEFKESQEHLYRQLARGQDNNTESIKAEFSKLYKILGAPHDDAHTPHEPLFVPDLISKRLDFTLRKAFPHLEVPKELSLTDGVKCLTYHLHQFTDTATPLLAFNGADKYVEVEKYLNLMKSVYILIQIKSSEEYDLRVTKLKELMWSNYIEELELSCRAELKRFSATEPETTKLLSPPDDEILQLFQDDFKLRFGGDQECQGDVGISIGDSEEELLHLPLVPLSIDSKNYQYELALVRRSDVELELRYLKIPATDSGNSLAVLTTVHLQKALLIPVWAGAKTPSNWSIRFRGDANTQTEGQFIFVKRTGKLARQHGEFSFIHLSLDLYLFQQAILGYKVSYDNDSRDVDIRIHDRSGGPKDIYVKGKIQIWQDEPLKTSMSPSMEPTLSRSSISALSSLSSQNPTCRSPMSFNSPSLRSSSALGQHDIQQRSLSVLSPSTSVSSRRVSRQDSILSFGAPSRASTARTSSSILTSTDVASVQTSQTRWKTRECEMTGVQFHNPKEPLLVLLVRSDESGREKYLLLGIKLDEATIARTGCNTRQCKTMKRCVHATIEKQSSVLNVMRVDASSDTGWNLAALGNHQQENGTVKTPAKMYYVHLAFATQEERDSFVGKFNRYKEVWENKCRYVESKKAEMRSLNVIKKCYK